MDKRKKQKPLLSQLEEAVALINAASLVIDAASEYGAPLDEVPLAELVNEAHEALFAFIQRNHSPQATGRILDRGKRLYFERAEWRTPR